MFRQVEKVQEKFRHFIKWRQYFSTMLENTKNEWMQVVKRIYGRKNFINYPKSCEIMSKLGYTDFYKNATIIDCYPGAGVFSAAIFNSLKPKKHVMIEPLNSFTKYLDTLKAGNKELEVVKLDPYRWATFSSLIDEGTLKIEQQPLNQIHNQVLFTANLTQLQGEQLCAQYLNCVTNRSWIQRFGRIRMLMWVRATTAEKLLAKSGERFRHRISAQCESACDARVIFHTRPDDSKKKKGTYPEQLLNPMMTLEEGDINGVITNPLSLIELTPKEKQPEYLDEFEYVLRTLFASRSLPLSESLGMLGPGAAEDLGVKLQDLLHKRTSDLDQNDFERIAKAFWEWPFKPTFLHDFYEEAKLGMGMGQAE